MGLFDAFADAKNVSAALRDAGRRLIDAATVEGSAAQPNPVHLSLSSVTVEGFGSFAERVEYPLARRGLLLLRGAHVPAGDSDVAEELTASNGAGKTTLAMAPLWALTGWTDTRADGKPVAARGVINDASARAEVTLRGIVSMLDAPHQSGDGAVQRAVEHEHSLAGREVPFEVVRSMSKRGHVLRFTLGDMLHNGTLAQVQEQVDAVFRTQHLSRIAFFGQHHGGGFWTRRMPH